MGYDMIELTTEGAVATIKLDRPKALNALRSDMMEEVAKALAKLEKDDSIGCVILTGSEKAFAAGADIKEMADNEYLEIYKNDPHPALRGGGGIVLLFHYMQYPC